MNSIVNKEWVLEHMNDNDFVLVDCRFALDDPSLGASSYEKDHISGAVYMDLEKDMSAPVSDYGGRHPLPNPDKFADRLGELSIHRSTRIVAYDDQGGAMASRLWWLMRYIGHEQAAVMGDSYASWVAAGYPISSDLPERPHTQYVVDIQKELLADMIYVKERLDHPDVILLDSREPQRYAGIVEPIDKKAGHIPGAINRFWKQNLNAEGTWKSTEQRSELFRDLDPSKEIIVYCGSGVTACPNVLTLTEAGFNRVKLYAGSWSDWISYEDNPIVNKES